MTTYLVDICIWGNLAICLGVGWICICRITLMDRGTTRPMFRLAYAGMFAAIVGCGFSPWLFGDEIGFGTVMLSAALCGHMLSSTPLWRSGVPEFGRSDAMPLDGFRTERRRVWR